MGTYDRALRDRLLAPSGTELAKNLPDAGEALLGAAIELSRDPQIDRCDRYLARLNGTVQLVNRLRATLIREAIPDFPPEAA
jgi:hypothetical protein